MAGYGRSMVLVKDVGAPADICARYGIPGWGGYQGIGHTRMATESAVTTAHSHPFAPAADLALVHNGSFSNYATIRRRLARRACHCDTDNDSEVAARLIATRMAAGADLEDALRTVLKEMDGFFTLLVTTRTQFAVVRDSFACKPAVIAETADYVAMASEYHALAGLPGIDRRRGLRADARGDPPVEPVIAAAARSCPPARSTPRWPRCPTARCARVARAPRPPQPRGRPDQPGATSTSTGNAGYFIGGLGEGPDVVVERLRRLVGRREPDGRLGPGAGQRLGVRGRVQPRRDDHHRGRRLVPGRDLAEGRHDRWSPATSGT